MRDVLNDAAGEAHAWLVARYEASFSSPYYETGRWALPGSRELLDGQATFFADPDVYPVDVRGVTFSYAYFTPKHTGAGSSYLLTIADKAGRLLDGGTTYRLTVPANVPVSQYWSATVYDRPMRPYGMPDGRAARPRRRDSARTLMGRWTSISGPRRQTARSRTGFPRAPTKGSRFSFASTAPKNRSSRRRGGYRTSRRWLEREHVRGDVRAPA
jgi:hypothetical protein